MVLIKSEYVQLLIGSLDNIFPESDWLSGHWISAVMPYPTNILLARITYISRLFLINQLFQVSGDIPHDCN